MLYDSQLTKLRACNFYFILFLSAEYDPVADEPVSVQDDEELQVFWLHAIQVIRTGTSEFFLISSIQNISLDYRYCPMRKEVGCIYRQELALKVPKREIFDRSDFPDFYTIKSLRVGDFGVKLKKILQNIQGFIKGCKVPYAYAQCIFKEVFFLSFGQKFFFSMALLRPLVSVTNNSLKF